MLKLEEHLFGAEEVIWIDTGVYMAFIAHHVQNVAKNEEQF